MTDQAAPSAKRIAILVEDDFEDRELPLLLELLRDTPLQIVVVGPVAGVEYKGKRLESAPVIATPSKVTIIRPAMG